MLKPEQSISVVIPTLNEEATIGPCLFGLQRQGFDNIVVVDGASSDGTRDIVGTFDRVRLVSSPPGRGRQIAAGLQDCERDAVILLHADTVLPAGAAAAVTSALGEADVAGGAFRLRFDVTHPLLDVSAWASRFETRWTTFGDQAFFARRDALQSVGIPDMALLEDVELRRRLKTVGRFVKLEPSVLTSARRFVRKGVIRCQARNAAILLGYFVGVPLPTLARAYGSRPAAQSGRAATAPTKPEDTQRLTR